MSECSDNGDFKLIKGIIICKLTGEYLVDVILDSQINPIMLSSFVGALSMFGKKNLGKIEEINIKGLDVEMIIVSRYNLILVAILDRDFLKNEIRDELEKLLDIFYSCYQEEIKECYEIGKFEEFKKVLHSQIQDYLYYMNGNKSRNKTRDFGFLSQIIEKMKNKI